MKVLSIKIVAVISAALLMLTGGGSSFIKWVDCAVSTDVLKAVYKLCEKYHGSENEFEFASGVAYIATRNGNKFSSKDKKYLKELESNIKQGNLAGNLKDNKYFKYHEQAYGAILKNFVGEYKTESGERGFGIVAYFRLQADTTITTTTISVIRARSVSSASTSAMI